MWGSISVVASLDRQGTNISKDFGPSQKCKVQKKEKKSKNVYILRISHSIFRTEVTVHKNNKDIVQKF